MLSPLIDTLCDSDTIYTSLTRVFSPITTLLPEEIAARAHHGHAPNDTHTASLGSSSVTKGDNNNTVSPCTQPPSPVCADTQCVRTAALAAMRPCPRHVWEGLRMPCASFNCAPHLLFYFALILVNLGPCQSLCTDAVDRSSALPNARATHLCSAHTKGEVQIYELYLKMIVLALDAYSHAFPLFLPYSSILPARVLLSRLEATCPRLLPPALLAW